MKTRAPELRALIIILGSAGPVISTRRSSKSGGAGATVQAASRISRVADEEVRPRARSSSAWRSVAALQELETQRAEAALQVGDEGERVVGQDPVGARDRSRRSSTPGGSRQDRGRADHVSPRRGGPSPRSGRAARSSG